MPVDGRKLPLVIFTHAFPFDGVEVSFLQHELRVLTKHFQPVILVPRNIGVKVDLIGAGVEVDESFSIFMNQPISNFRKFLLVLFSKSFFTEIVSNFPCVTYGENFKRIFQALFDAMLTQKWVENKIAVSHYSGKWLFYTYWLGKYTLGIGNAKKKNPNIHLISRAHRNDLYSRNKDNLYMPVQKQAIKASDWVFSISENGRKYLQFKYPLSTNIGCSRLGVIDPGQMCEYPTDGTFRIVSCSSLRPVKRVDLLARGLCIAAEKRPAQLFRWDHFGDGETRILIENEIAKFPPNIHFHLGGQVSNEMIIEFYRSNTVNLFINVSASEGIPMSIMEAFSFGIPALATGVGGTPEIVNQDCGWLLSENPSSEEIAESLLKCIDDPSALISKRKAARKMWFDEYNADVNFERFAQTLKTMVS